MKNIFHILSSFIFAEPHGLFNADVLNLRKSK